MKHTILCVDDEIDNVEALERIFRKKYTVLKAVSAAEGLALIKKNKVSLIISDQRMPKKTGVEFLTESIEYCPDAIRILLTGYTDIESVIDSINSGQVYRYLTKPWDSVDLANTVDKAIEKYELAETLKIKNQELEVAYKELKTLDDAKNNFMILINHELKTPLTVILSFLDLLTESSPNVEQKKYIERIKGSSYKLKTIIDDVLTFVSAETGIMKVAKKKISIQKLLAGLSEKYLAETEQKKQKIIWPKNDLDLKADPMIVTTAIDRLLSNAVRFGDEGGRIEIMVEPLKTGFAELIVQNEGPAIDSDTIEKIMKPFTLDEDALKHSKGLGLGLSLTQALLKRHSSALKITCPKGHVRASFLIEQA